MGAEVEETETSDQKLTKLNADFADTASNAGTLSIL